MATKTKFLGICPVCEGQFKLDASNQMVHHGFTRPGDGMIHGDCFAVGRLAYELSCDATKEYLGLVLKSEENTLAYLGRLESGEIKSLTVETWRKEIKVINEGDREFAETLRSKISSTKGKLVAIEMEKKRLEKMIANWVLSQVTPVEEQEKLVQETKAAAKARVQAARDAKIAEKVAKLQKRVDTALRTKSFYTIAQVFENATTKLYYEMKVSREEGLAALKRDHVWVAFGLTTPEGKLVEGAGRIASDMMYHFGEDKRVWPVISG